MSRDGFLRFGLIGWPVEHSLSPRIHQAALDYLGLKGQYSLYPIPPELGPIAGMAELVDRLRQSELDGLNVTIPHKIRICDLIDELSPEAEVIGAVNTLYAHNGRVVGANTDVPGFLAAVQTAFPKLFAEEGSLAYSAKITNSGTNSGGTNSVSAQGHENFPRQALLLGAGGAARAVAYALLARGWLVTVAARSLDAAKILVNRFTEVIRRRQIQALHLDAEALSRYLRGTKPDLIVNASAAGMAPQEGISAWPENVQIPDSACVYDLVYNPRETLFTRLARAAGCQVENGVGMLVEQAACAFELWTGLAAPRPAMRAAVQIGGTNDFTVLDRG